ncbi:UvrD-helicase domain-containing protein [Paraburkholderia sp. CNPSo 3272]|uniref:UvrD-helicase domain-containing protein n=1 Tax=Paraburkholderia sp. CNPSo 3272 TaxID=2940931 RepID=UPI0020B820EC|nr:UvrD-helicase domain-containing protein [Paraburkholderia sp. CNPSo 3272]MCP3722586.1 UvrD-helicase domain-containing protein [Paraburkholderia sp. CNPSo 3272]
MLEPSVRAMVESRIGSIEAPAGTGKTEQIARIAGQLPGRWLVLTHTIAGRDAIRRRMTNLGVAASKAQVDTLAAWSHRWATAYPKASHLPVATLRAKNNWTQVQTAAAMLVESGAVASVLKASYEGVLIDEYQDCSESHHRLACALSKTLRCYVFGDPYQAIFGFSKEDALVDWQATALSVFPLHGKLSEPRRWIAAKNEPLGRWLLDVRESVANGVIDLRDAPVAVEWVEFGPDEQPGELAKRCRKHGQRDGEVLVVIDSSTRVTRRADIAKRIGGTTIEPVAGPCETEFYTALASKHGIERIQALLDLAGTAYTGVNVAQKLKRVDSILERPNKLKNAPSEAELAISAVARDDTVATVLDALDSIGVEAGVRVVRPELVSSVKSTLRLMSAEPSLSIVDACWQIANRKRQRGRTIRNRSVGSTLLVKGLEFDHAVITPHACTTRFDWYVALTRATRSVRVLSPGPVVNVD